MALLARRPTAQRQVVELRLTGLRDPIIARALADSHVSVRVMQVRACSRLRDLISRTGNAEKTGPDR
jgi:hypothetical protein